jgi:hypothetical protein
VYDEIGQNQHHQDGVCFLAYGVIHEGGDFVAQPTVSEPLRQPFRLIYGACAGLVCIDFMKLGRVCAGYLDDLGFFSCP